MQTHGGTEAEEVILASERHFIPELLVDWNRNGQFDHELSDLSHFVQVARTDRALKGSAPEELMLIEGASAAELTAVLSGEHNGLTMVEIFAPHNGNSPLYAMQRLGVEVKYAVKVVTAVGVVSYPQFVGSIRAFTPNRSDGSVDLECLDRVEALRRPVHFPPWGISEYHAARGIYRAQLCDTQWVIDHCLRQCDTSPTSFRPTYREELAGVGDRTKDGVQFYLTGTGSHLPTVGWMDNSEVQEFPHTESTGVEMFTLQGAYANNSPEKSVTAPMAFAEMGSGSGVVNKYWCLDRDLIGAEGTHYLGFTLNTRDADGFWKTGTLTSPLTVRIGDKRVLSIKIQAGQIWSERLYEPDGTIYASTKLTIPTGNDWHVVRCIWDNTPQTGTRVYLGVGGVETNGFETPPGSIAWNGVAEEDDLKGLVQISRRVSMNDLYYATRFFYDPAIEFGSAFRTAKRTAVLDPGRNRFSYMPARASDDAWKTITEVAAAEFGSVFWDENGVFHFWNYEHVLGKQKEIVRTLELDDVSGLQSTHSLDSVRNIWTVEAGKRVAVEDPNVAAYSAKSVDEFHVPHGGISTDHFRVWVDDVESPYPWKLTRYNGADWNDSRTHGYVVQYWWDNTWQEQPTWASPDVTVYFDTDGFLTVRVDNNESVPIRFAVGDQPALRFRGTRIDDGDPQAFTARTQSSIDKYGGRNYALSGDWYQDLFQSDGMLDVLMPRTAEPIPATDSISIAGDPRLQLGDCVEALDPNGLGERVPLQILGIENTLDVEQGFTSRLTVEVLQPVTTGVWDSEQYGRWDETFVWSD